MSQEQRHQMKLVNTHSSGAEEWFCPSCGYRFMIQWPPEYKKIVLENGDQHAAAGLVLTLSGRSSRVAGAPGRRAARLTGCRLGVLMVRLFRSLSFRR